jgi:hypothetical protein
MIRHTLLAAAAISAAVALTACTDATAPPQLPSGVSLAATFPRSGAFHLTKDCSTYTGHAGDICTITSSSVKEVAAGSRIIYASDAVGASLDTDVRLDLPGSGHNSAFGHCTLSLATGIGACELSGGTGKFTEFHANVAVSPLGGPDFAWDGTYSFSPGD